MGGKTAAHTYWLSKKGQWVKTSLIYEDRFGMNHDYTFALLQIILQDLSVFNVLAVAQELGLTDLQLSCEEHISATLSPGNACAFYSAALQMEQERRQAGKFDGVLWK